MAKSAHHPVLEDLLLPLMVCSPDGMLEALGLPSLRSARHVRTADFIGPRHLDLGCGPNVLRPFEGHAHVVGLDVQVSKPQFNPSVVGVAERLPFLDGVFDSASMVACLNHFGERDKVIDETFRVLKPGGRVVVTMIGPLVGLVCHKFRFWHQDTLHRDVHPGEVDGMNRDWIERLFGRAGMPCVHEETFLAGLNRMFVFEKPAALAGASAFPDERNYPKELALLA